jgi:cytochrome P450
VNLILPIITLLLPFLVPIKKLKEQDEMHHQLTVSKTAKRIENKHKKGAFNPFSLGPRGCLGVNLAYLEMRVILARVVWELEWEMVGSVDWVRENRAVPL